jgi:transcriptional regulator with XRE-family HTH domain
MIGEAIKIIRVFNGMTQQELAKTLDISDSYLSQIESGKRTPTLETMSAISKTFRIPVSSLMFFSEQLGSDRNPRDRERRLAFGRRLIEFLSKAERAAE